ncbi:MAG: glycosyltransferase [Xanthobacteraceae bacterium]
MSDVDQSRLGHPTQRPIVAAFFGNPMIRSDGCHARVLEMLDFLSEFGSDLTFYSFENYPVWPWSEHHITEFKRTFPNVHLVLDRWSRSANLLRRCKNALCSLMPQVSATLAELTVPWILPEWIKIRRNHRDAIYFITYADSLTQLNGIDFSRVIVDTHDLSFRNYGLVTGKSAWRPGVIRRLRRELSLLESTAMVIAIAPNETSFFQLMLKSTKVCYVPPRIPPAGKIHENTAIEADILFVGSDNVKNVRYINSFLSKYQRWRSFPSLAVAGNVCRHLSGEYLRAGNIKVKGYVDDLPALYRSVRAVICPVEGTGVNIKAMEALAYGKPVFASASAIGGLPPGSEACVFPLGEESVCGLLADPERLKQASQAAVAYVDSPFIRQAWSNLGDDLRSMIRKD